MYGLIPHPGLHGSLAECALGVLVILALGNPGLLHLAVPSICGSSASAHYFKALISGITFYPALCMALMPCDGCQGGGALSEVSGPVSAIHSPLSSTPRGVSMLVLSPGPGQDTTPG